MKIELKGIELFFEEMTNVQIAGKRNMRVL